MTGVSAVRIAVLLPEALGTYSDRGNVTVLAQRARWRGLAVEVTTVHADTAPPLTCDLYVLGGGEDVAQLFAARWLRERPRLCATLADRASTLAVCAGMQILGERMRDPAGHDSAGAGVLPLITVAGCRRTIGEAVVRADLPGVGLLTGFENHLGRTVLGAGVRPLGRVLRGTGNGAGERVEGVQTRTVVGTYLHGPVLARNPALADELLERATGLRLTPLELPEQAAVRRLRLRARRLPRPDRATRSRPAGAWLR